MALPPVVALEIGTSKTLALVGEMREGGHVMITGMGRVASAGVRKGEVVDLENAGLCVRSVLAQAEESGMVNVHQVHMAISGGHIRSRVSRGALPVLDRDGEIGAEDVQQVMEVARAANLPAEREILHTICQHFLIDDEHRVERPEGMEGGKLALDMLILHGDRSRLRNAVKVVHGMALDVQDVVFSGLCSAVAVLTDEQKKSGAVVIDMGGGTTDFVAYADNVVANAGVIGVGGDHVTNDLVLAFSIPVMQAEKIKREFGCVPPTGSGPSRIALPAEMGFPGRSVDVESLHQVAHARVEETLTLVRRQLDETGALKHAGAGVVLTGGAAHTRGICRVAQDVFGLPCSVGKPRSVTGLATATEGPEYAACVGLVHNAFESLADEGRLSPLGWLRGLLGR